MPLDGSKSHSHRGRIERWRHRWRRKGTVEIVSNLQRKLGPVTNEPDEPVSQRVGIGKHLLAYVEPFLENFSAPSP